MNPIPDGSSSGSFSPSIASQANVDAENANEEEDGFEDEFRLKLEYIDFCLSRVYGAASAKDMIKKLKDIIHRLFEYYSMMNPIPDGSSSGSFSSSIASQANVDAENVMRKKTALKMNLD
ncbi:hypothetical protein PIB30_038518 [Stylosanthes scabra]|uniref:Uncharacterized protein n=1 Tax=Stylosanthes scabra TaxID=79078 RepID=A0ABU6UDD0_9FABA|nr:hypothetical protein [Stylosanthes scabra]